MRSVDKWRNVEKMISFLQACYKKAEKIFVLWLQWRESGDLPLAATATFVSALSTKRLQEVEDAANFGGQVPTWRDRPLIKRENPIS